MQMGRRWKGDDRYRRVVQVRIENGPRHGRAQLFPTTNTGQIVRSGVHDVPTLVCLQPQRLRSVLSEMAEQLSDSIANHKVTKVGILTFSSDTQVGNVLGTDFAPLGRCVLRNWNANCVARGAGNIALSISSVCRRRFPVSN